MIMLLKGQVQRDVCWPTGSAKWPVFSATTEHGGDGRSVSLTPYP